jgi:hypothetical protein
MSKQQIIADKLTLKQAVKWFLLHERERHLKDVAKIEADLEKLCNVELPELSIDLWVEVPERETP